MAACLLLAISLSWNMALWRRSAGDAAGEVIAGHVRALMGTHLLDVASSDRHTVKPWFAGKLDFAPDVRDLNKQGFPLLGGRVDYVGGRPVAALVFRRRQHIINLWTWPSGTGEDEATVSRKGYNAVRWDSAGMTYWAVSDLGLSELGQFARFYR